jgi:hypothetical protein
MIMTLIVAQLDRNGIVLASDSNLTSSNRVEREGRKAFELPHLRAGLSVSGCYAVDNVPMDEWIPRFIAREETYARKTIAGFADCLRLALDCEMRADQKSSLSLIHLAGYERDERGFHPEFYSVTNATTLDPNTGNYIGIRDAFTAIEDFWSRDCKFKEAQTGFPPAPGPYIAHHYVNGFPDARIAYIAALHSLMPYFDALWSQPQRSYRPPKTLQESTTLLRMLMTIMADLFKISDYSALYVGGETQLVGIPFPVA